MAWCAVWSISMKEMTAETLFTCEATKKGKKGKKEKRKGKGRKEEKKERGFKGNYQRKDNFYSFLQI